MNTPCDTATPRCPLCHANQSRLISCLDTSSLIDGWQRQWRIDIADELIGDSELRLYCCGRCDLRWFLPARCGSPRLYAELQRFDWYYLADRWEHREALRDVRPGQRVLEIGCGRGDFVAQASQLGAHAHGIELNDRAIREAQTLGRAVTAADLRDLASSQPGSFDVVCAFQVLEHVADPRTFLEQARSLLAPSGRLVICVPDADSYLKYQRFLLDLPPHHVTRWTRTCLERTAPLLGMRLQRLLIEPLSEQHVEGYVRSLAARFGTQRWLGRGRPAALLGAVISALRQHLKGQSLYACYTA